MRASIRPLASRCATVLPQWRCAARWQSSQATATSRKYSTPLAKSLAEAITTTGPIPVATYMRQCLTNPDGGYYTSRGRDTSSDPFGKRGDFITSPEISQIFGELIGLWVFVEWRAQGITGKVNMIELGPGRGTLMDDVLRTLRNFKPLMSSIDKIWLVEASANLRDAQHRLLCGDAPLEACEEGFKSRCKYSPDTEIIWCEDMRFVPSENDVAPFIVAHEFFDALPIHIFQSVAPKAETSNITTSTTTLPPVQQTQKNQANDWREMLVNPVSPYDAILNARAKKAGPAPDFELIMSQAPTPHSQLLPRLSDRYQKVLATPGANIEISPESQALASDFAKRIGGSSSETEKMNNTQPKGAALILDYGPSSTIPTNSLRGIQSHKPISPFAMAGEVDISADVDFIGLAHAALDASPRVEVHGPVEQALFLSAMGIKERADVLVGKAGGDEEVKKRIETSWKRLVDRGPDGMGKTYKVMALLPYIPEKELRRPVGFGGDITA